MQTAHQRIDALPEGVDKKLIRSAMEKHVSPENWDLYMDWVEQIVAATDEPAPRGVPGGN